MESFVWKKKRKMLEGEIKEIYRTMTGVHQMRLSGATLRTNQRKQFRHSRQLALLAKGCKDVKVYLGSEKDCKNYRIINA